MTRCKKPQVYKSNPAKIYSQLRVSLSDSKFLQHGYTSRLMDAVSKEGIAIYDIEYISPDLIIAKFNPTHEFPIKGFQGEKITKVSAFIADEYHLLVLLGSIEDKKYIQLPDLNVKSGRNKTGASSHASIKNSPHYGSYQKLRR